jgi:hypothetical protein
MFCVSQKTNMEYRGAKNPTPVKSSPKYYENWRLLKSPIVGSTLLLDLNAPNTVYVINVTEYPELKKTQNNAVQLRLDTGLTSSQSQIWAYTAKYPYEVNYVFDPIKLEYIIPAYYPKGTTFTALTNDPKRPYDPNYGMNLIVRPDPGEAPWRRLRAEDQSDVDETDENLIASPDDRNRQLIAKIGVGVTIG